jgi:uncharacterized protein (DUF952 family)
MVPPMQILFKICPEAEWTAATAKGVFAGSAADHADGFIHLSAAHQVRETAARHFAGRHGLVLVAFAGDDLPGLKWEPSRGGALFPHVHGTIAVSLARWVKPLPLEAGSHVFPAEVPG